MADLLQLPDRRYSVIYADPPWAYENDVVTGADGMATLSDMPSGCYEIEETDVPAPYLLDTNNRKTVWIDATKDQDVVVDFVNSTRPGLRLLKIDQQTGEPLSGVLFRIAEVNGGYDEQHFTNAEGLIVLEGLNPGAYTVQEVKPKNGWVADDKELLGWAKGKRITAGPVFQTSGGKTLDRSNIWREMKGLCGAAGVDSRKVFPHNLRHLFAVLFYKVNKDIAKLADILGHTSISTTRIYIMETSAEHERQLAQLGLVV